MNTIAVVAAVLIVCIIVVIAVTRWKRYEKNPPMLMKAASGCPPCSTEVKIGLLPACKCNEGWTLTRRRQNVDSKNIGYCTCQGFGKPWWKNVALLR